MISTREIIEKGNLKKTTFECYRKLGLLPPPIKREYFKGHGSQAYYDEVILYNLEIIKFLKKQGYKLKAIRDMIKSTAELEKDGVKTAIPVDPDPGVTFLKLGEELKKKYPEKKLTSYYVRFENIGTENIGIIITAILTNK